MRFFLLTLLVPLIGAAASAQKRYLVSQNDDIIPLLPRSSVAEVLRKWTEQKRTATGAVCADQFWFGNDPSYYPVMTTMGGYHKDVFGAWFVAKASGTIDTIYWLHYGEINARDSTVYLRVHTSEIGPDYGPGVRPGPYDPPCQYWGYWKNTNDLDQGVAAFIEEATDTTWISTIGNSPVPSAPPFAGERWGYGGFPVWVQPGTLMRVPMSVLGDTIGVTTGESFFISLRMPWGCEPEGHCEHSDEGRTDIVMYNRRVTTDDEDYPSRLWKFYEHAPGPIGCGLPDDSTRPGWIVLGGESGDSLDVAMYGFWYLMTVTTNVPPIITSQTVLTTTFRTGPQEVRADIEDCNPENPGGAGVVNAVIQWSLDETPMGDIPMSHIGGDTWEGTIPGQGSGHTVTYRIAAIDQDSAAGRGMIVTYSVVPFGTEWYSLDTGFVCEPQDISGSGTEIAPGDFFVPPDPPFTGAGTASADDGTAGPFDMGGEFRLFGDDFRYAWVGVNGAIALSKEATDTTDVNANGHPSSDWTFPGDAVWGRRADTAKQGLMPPMFIAPYWADHILADSTRQYGHIYYGSGGDTCQFVVEWDSLGAFDYLGPLPDRTKFRVILNRCVGTVEFQYDLIGTTGLDSANLVGMQGDSNLASGPEPGWVSLNRNGYPIETRIRDGTCVRLYPNVGTVAMDGWNMVAASLTPNSGSYAVSELYPTAVSQAFGYVKGYGTADSLGKGEGFWLKFDGSGPVGAAASTFDHVVTATVEDGWNMIGGPSGVAYTGDIAVSGGTVASEYIGYGKAGYFFATEILPGKGYWVKMNGAGTLSLISSGAVPKAVIADAGKPDLSRFNRLTFSDAYGRAQTLYLGPAILLRKEPDFFEQPPPPPAGAYDVRYGSQRMLETYPEDFLEREKYDYPIMIRGALYPVTVSWEILSPVGGNRQMVMRDGAVGTKIHQIIEGSGRVMIKDPAVQSVVIGLLEGVDIPVRFALGPNYPNPFNPLTHFTVDIPRATEVIVAVYDLLGRRITTLFDGVRAPGSYTLAWDGRDGSGVIVPSGIYFVRMNAGDFSATRKIMVIR